jgi:hypothetical protein
LKAFCRVVAEHGGLCSIEFYRLDDAPGLQERTLAGDQRATLHLQELCGMILALRSKRPPRCVFCGNEDQMQLVAVLEGYCESSKGAIGRLICTPCAARHSRKTALRDALLKIFSDRMRLNLRVLPCVPMLPARVH